MKIAVGSDEQTHVTTAVVAELERLGHEVSLYGPLRGESALWPDVARQVAESVTGRKADEGILFCWTGTGVSLAANKVPGIRAALCDDAETARGARLWNNANVLCMSLRRTTDFMAKEILAEWFDTAFDPDENDALSLAQVEALERDYMRDSDDEQE